MVYNITTKIIVSRIKPLLDKIISSNQCSFILGHSPTDNSIIVQETIHSFNRAKGGTCHMMLKIDLEKAFDRLEWVLH